MSFLEKKCGFGSDVKVGQFTKSFQTHFARWSAEKYRHTPSYIARNLSVIAAACRFATKTAIQKAPDGQLREVRILKFMPEISFDAKWVAEITEQPEPKPRGYVPTFEELASLLDMGSIVSRDILSAISWRPAFAE